MNDKEMLKRRLMMNQFAVNEVVLFLDTHPNNREALAAFEKYRSQSVALRKEYEEKYGMIDMFSPNNCADKWTWVDSPWPWERQ